MRNSTRLMFPLVLILVLTVSVPAAALGIDIDDPNVFGPGEAWEVPAAIAPGASGPWDTRLQQRLVDAGFRPGANDGSLVKPPWGRSTLSRRSTIWNRTESSSKNTGSSSMESSSSRSRPVPPIELR